MSELLVLVPLSIFGDAKDLTVESLQESLSKSIDHGDEIALLKIRLSEANEMLKQIGNTIEAAWEIPDIMTRAKAFRKIIEETKKL